MIRGRETQPHSRPYMAFLNIRCRNRRSHCGGFLVAKNFVLTAAHCNGEDITVLLGAHNLRRDEETQQRVSVKHKIPHPGYNKMSFENDLMLLQFWVPHFRTDVEKLERVWRTATEIIKGLENLTLEESRITVYLGAHNIQQREQSQQKIPVRCRIPHPQYNRETRNNDIMLLQLSHSAVLNNWVQLIPLPNANSRVRPGSMCSVAGWGRTGWNIRTDRLREVDLEVMRDNMCELYSGYNPSTMLCVGKPGMRKLPYRGDSGGPLACDGVAQGIASYVDGNFYQPSVFTRLSTFIPWIQNILQKQH